MPPDVTVDVTAILAAHQRALRDAGEAAPVAQVASVPQAQAQAPAAAPVVYARAPAASGPQQTGARPPAE